MTDDQRSSLRKTTSSRANLTAPDTGFALLGWRSAAFFGRRSRCELSFDLGRQKSDAPRGLLCRVAACGSGGQGILAKPGRQSDRAEDVCWRACWPLAAAAARAPCGVNPFVSRSCPWEIPLSKTIFGPLLCTRWSTKMRCPAGRTAGAANPPRIILDRWSWFTEPGSTSIRASPSSRPDWSKRATVYTA